MDRKGKGRNGKPSMCKGVEVGQGIEGPRSETPSLASPASPKQEAE